MSKDSGREYAVKIVDKSQEEAITESIAVETQILQSLPHHKHISELHTQRGSLYLYMYMYMYMYV